MHIFAYVDWQVLNQIVNIEQSFLSIGSIDFSCIINCALIEDSIAYSRISLQFSDFSKHVAESHFSTFIW